MWMCIITEGQTTSEKKIDRTAKTNRLIHYRSWRFRFQHLTLKWADAVGVSKDTVEVNIPINHLFAIVIYKLVCPTTAEQTFIKTYQNLWDVMKATLRRKSMALDAFLEMEKMSKINNLSYPFRKPEMKFNVSRRK